MRRPAGLRAYARSYAAEGRVASRVAASDADLKHRFTDHLELMRNHVLRLEQIFEILGAFPKGKICQAMEDPLRASGVGARSQAMVRRLG